MEAEWAGATASGRLKFGTLAEYRAIEGNNAQHVTEHRLSDTGEGIYALHTSMPYSSLNGTFGNAHFNNCSFGVVGDDEERATLIQVPFDAYAFCATRGDYSERRHCAILEKNSSLTHFVVFDKARFTEAVHLLRSAISPSNPPGGLLGAAIYEERARKADERREIENSGDIRGRSEREMFVRAAFIKPARFKHEHELRYVIPIVDDRAAIFTRDFDSNITEAFAAAATARGQL